MIIYSIYFNEILIRFAAMILASYILSHEIQNVGHTDFIVNGTTIKHDYDMSTFYFEIWKLVGILKKNDF